VLINAALWPLLYLPILLGGAVSMGMLGLAVYPGVLRRLMGRMRPGATGAGA